MSAIPGSGRSTGGGLGNLLQCSCLENPMDRRAWRSTVHGVTKSWTWLKWLSTIQVYTYSSILAWRIPVFLPGEFHGQRSLQGYSPWGCKELELNEWLTLCQVLYMCVCIYIYICVCLYRYVVTGISFRFAALPNFSESFMTITVFPVPQAK